MAEALLKKTINPHPKSANTDAFAPETGVNLSVQYQRDLMSVVKTISMAEVQREYQGYHFVSDFIF